MTEVLITGVSGQDGGYLAEQLLAQGCVVHGLIRSDDEAPALLRQTPGLRLHTGDVTDTARISDLVVSVRPDEIYNLAGLSSVARSWAEPVSTGQINGLAVAGLLQAALELRLETGRPTRFVQASSAEIFGNPRTSPQDETTPVVPVTPYGAAKAYAHHLVGVYRQRGLHASSMILYNHESPRRPDTFVTRKITRGAADIVRGRASELVLGNLDARRDWGWAPDYMDALVRAARHAEPGDYVVATGRSRTVRDFVAAAFAAAGVHDWERYLRSDPAFFRPVDAVELVGDATRARQVLGWRPTVTFDEMVARMVRADLS